MKDLYLILTILFAFATIVLSTTCMFLVYDACRGTFREWIAIGQRFWPLGVIDAFLLFIAAWSYRQYKRLLAK